MDDASESNGGRTASEESPSLSTAGCLLGLAIWQAHSLSLGLFFSGAFLVCHMWPYWVRNECSILDPPTYSTSPKRFLLRHATHNLQRPGNFTKAMTLAIGIGVMLMFTLHDRATTHC